jgi:hypothetical protein
MAKTYNTISTFTSGQVLTAAQMNEIGTNVNNYRVPPLIQVRRSSDQTGYTGGSAITWNDVSITDTDPTMWAASPNPTRITVNTAGVYLVNFTGEAGGAATVSVVSANIARNGTLVAGSFNPALNNAAPFMVSTVLNLSATDYLEAACNFAGGSAYFVSGNASVAQDQTRLTVVWLGQAS